MRHQAESQESLYDLSLDLGCGEYGSVNSYATLIREKNNSQSELPQCTTVRRAMFDCSHLFVPMAVPEIYPTGAGGSQMTPNMPNFALIATACPPRVPYPHMAVQRSFTVTDDAKAAAAMSTMMSSTLMASIVLPSSPPPLRHHGSCETNFLFAVPPPAVTAVNIKENDLKGKSFLLCQNKKKIKADYQICQQKFQWLSPRILNQCQEYQAFLSKEKFDNSKAQFWTSSSNIVN